MADTRLTVHSPAKINWNLRVLGKREDGFHDIESLVSAITLYDELTFTERPDSLIKLTCNNNNVPTDRSNLIYQAITLLAEKPGCHRGVTCHLEKRIPLGGGLGGGSSNAASTLLALNQLWSLNWPVERLMPLASKLGSDVPFFLHGGTAIISGRGEQIRPIHLPWKGWIVLVMPDFSVSTAEVYSQWRPVSEATIDQEAVKPSGTDGAVAWMEKTFNMLEEPAIKVCPQLGELVKKSSELAKRTVRVSGSGSTLFTAFDDKNEAQQFADHIGEKLNVRTCVVEPVKTSLVNEIRMAASNQVTIAE
ncbi:MAG: 4-(cytidine 5'-diphospho)-2-C-methyl-D-erythritol kinase [Planctomycetota bacterium]|nr:MAG: 4-(cytidine 5'-diphospho)-2-C-methyl-D-erythritol kinase [Planctomycetota bacterium]